MIDWAQLKQTAPELAEAANARVDGKITFLATLRKDGSPRLHPVRPFVCDEDLILFSSGGSPKTADMQRDPRIVLHPNFDASDKTGGELLLSGCATELGNAEQRARIGEVSPFPVDQGVVFALRFHRIVGLMTGKDGTVLRVRWTLEDGYRATPAMG